MEAAQLTSLSPDMLSSSDGCWCNDSCQKKRLALCLSPSGTLFAALNLPLCVSHCSGVTVFHYPSQLLCIGWQLPKAAFKCWVNCDFEGPALKGDPPFICCTVQEFRSHILVQSKFKDLFKTVGRPSEFLPCFHMVLLPDKNRSIFFPPTNPEQIYNMCKGSEFVLSDITITHQC